MPLVAACLCIVFVQEEMEACFNACLLFSAAMHCVAA